MRSHVNDLRHRRMDDLGRRQPGGHEPHEKVRAVSEPGARRGCGGQGAGSVGRRQSRRREWRRRRRRHIRGWLLIRNKRTEERRTVFFLRRNLLPLYFFFFFQNLEDACSMLGRGFYIFAFVEEEEEKVELPK